MLQLVYAVVGPVQLYYQTTPGEVYGPFPDQQVFSWWKQGYFADDLPVSTDGSSFVAIRQFFGSNNPQISQPSVIPEPKVQADTEMNGYSMVEYQPRKSSFFSFKDITKKAKSMVKSKLSKINMYRFGRSRDEDLTPQSVGFYESGQSAEIRGTQLDGEEEEYNSDYSGYDDESSEVNEKGISPGVSVSIDEPRAKQQPEVGGDFVDSLSDSQNEEEKAFLRSNAPKSEQRRDDYDDYSVKSIGVKDYDVWNTELDGKSSFYDVGSSESGLARKIKRAAMSFTALITYPLLFLVSLIVPSSLRLYGVLLIQSGSIAGGVIALIAVLELINKILKGTGFSIFLLWLASLEAHLASKFKESSVLMSCPSSSSECGSIEQFSGSPTPFSAITEETRTNFSGKAGNVPRSVMELIKGIDLQNTIKDSVAYIRSATFHRNTKMAILFVFALSVLNSIWLPWSKELLRKRLGRSSQESLVGNEIKIDHVAAFRYVSQFTKILISFIIMGLSSYTSTAIGNILQISINSQMLLNFPNLLIICIGIVEMVLVKPVLSWSGDTNYAKKDSVLEEFEFR